MAAVETYGKLLIVGKDGKDHACDIRIVNKEISRKHAELYTEENGTVFINSMGREPVSVNGAPVVSPVELATGDKIEVHLEGRTRIFYFHSNEDTVQVVERKPLAHLNAAASVKATSPSPLKPGFSPAKKNAGDEGNMPPPPPPQDNATQKQVEEPPALPVPAAPATQEKEMPMDVAVEEPIAPISVVEEELPTMEEPIPLEKTETLPAFEEMEQPVAEIDAEPLIDATEKVEFTAEEEMMDVEPMMVEEITTEEENFEEEEENTTQLVSNIVSQAIAAAVLAENNTKNDTSSEPDIVQVEEMDTMMVDEENQHAEHPALAVNEGCVPPSTSQKTKKSVRFTATATGTPEGAAHDVTSALPFALNTANDGAVMVDDDTMAFAQWAGFGAVGAAAADGADGEEEEKMMSHAEDTKQATPLLLTAPASINRRQSVAPSDTLLKAKAQVSKFVSEAIAAAAKAAAERRQSAAPDTLIKAKAQVSRFVSEAIAAAVSGCATPQTGALAAKLTELEQEHDVTFELPADFMRWTPAPLSSKQVLSITVAVNPRGSAAEEEEGKDGREAAAATATTPAGNARTSLAPQELAAKLAELEQEHDITFELPVDFMRWTPAPATAGKKAIAVGVTPQSAAVAAAKAATPAKGMTPAAPGAQAPAPTPNTAITAQKSAHKRKMSLDPTSLAAKLSALADEHDVNFELPADFMRWTPVAKRTVSIAVTPRIANAPASVAKSQRSVPRSAVRVPALTPAKSHMTPAGPGAQAPAPTPATAAKSVGRMISQVAGLPVDTGALAAKLAELAEQHDVTFELPADFMRWTPAPGNKTSGNVIIAPFSAIKSQQRSAGGRSCMAQAVEAKDNAADAFPAATDEVMQHVMEKSNAENNDDGFSGGDLEASLEAVASAHKTPMSKSAAASLSRRRSSIRTPGTKIAIIGRSTPRSVAPSSVKNVRSSPRNAIRTSEKKQQQQEEEREDIEMGDIEVAAEVIEKEASGENVKEKSAMEAENDATVAIPTVAEEMTAQATEDDNAEEAEEEEDEDFDYNEQDEDEAAGFHRVPFVPLADYRRAVVQVRIHRSRATGLASQLRGVSARALRLKRAATGLAKALEEERAKRQELQATLQRIVANREAEENAAAEQEEKEMFAGEDEDGMDCDGLQEEVLGSPVQVKVVVVGYNPAPQPCHTEMAGNVVVVRPNTANTTTATTTTPTKATVGSATGVAKTPAGKTGMKSKTPGTLKKSMRKTPAGGRVLDDVEVPSWVFDTNTAGAPAVDVTAELAEVAAAEAAEARDAAALKNLHAQVAQVVEDADSEEDEDVQGEHGDEPDRCHKCNEGEEGDVLLLCDGCDNACHLSCCNPPLKKVPKGDWFCIDCKKAQKVEEAAAAKKASAPAAAGRGKKRAAATAAAPAEGKKTAPAKKAAAKKATTTTTASAGAGTKRGRGATTAAAQEERAPAAKKTRGGRQATPASTEKPAAAKRTTRARR